MSTIGREGRSFAAITPGDLRRLLAIAEADIADLFVRCPNWAELYADRLLAVTLCQGAAQHFCFCDTGINDFDVFTFFARNPHADWCYRRHPVRDFGDARFGKSFSNPEFVGRRVDLLSRAIWADKLDDPADAIRAYLRNPPTTTARLLAAKAVVLLKPRLGEQVWPE